MTEDPIRMSRDEMIDTLKGLVFGTFDRTTAKEREALDMAIKALEQEQKQKTGKWIIDNEYMDRRKMYHYSVHCSNCGFRGDYSTDEEGSVMSNFCPNCGARMIESQESEE